MQRARRSRHFSARRLDRSPFAGPRRIVPRFTIDDARTCRRDRRAVLISHKPLPTISTFGVGEAPRRDCPREVAALPRFRIG
jgi:hypothetical protein